MPQEASKSMATISTAANSGGSKPPSYFLADNLSHRQLASAARVSLRACSPAKMNNLIRVLA